MRMRVRIRSRKGVVTMIALLSIEAISGSLLQESWRDRLRPNEFELSMTRSAPRSGFVQLAVAADADRCVTTLRVRYHLASRPARLNRRDVGRPGVLAKLGLWNSRSSVKFARSRRSQQATEFGSTPDSSETSVRATGGK